MTYCPLGVNFMAQVFVWILGHNASLLEALIDLLAQWFPTGGIPSQGGIS